MKIIVLDDAPEEIKAFNKFLEEYYPQSEVCLTHNLLTFHEVLFDSGAKAPFDKIIIDAQLEMPNDMDETYYKEFLREVLIDEESIKKNDLLGWRYFDRFLRLKLPERIRDIVIKTGFENTVRIKAIETKRFANILNKGDSTYYKKLKEFLNN